MNEYSCVNTFNTGHTNFISCIIVISNNRLISGSNDKTIKVWNMNDNSLITTLTGHAGWIIGLISSTKHRNRLVSVSYDYKYKLWDMDNYNCIKDVEIK
jgi:WD40 repeat protein